MSIRHPRRAPTPYREDPRKQALKSKFSRKQKPRIKGMERGVKEGRRGATPQLVYSVLSFSATFEFSRSIREPWGFIGSGDKNSPLRGRRRPRHTVGGEPQRIRRNGPEFLPCSSTRRSPGEVPHRPPLHA